MFSNFISEAVSELFAIPSAYFVILQRLSIAALLIVFLIKIIIPYFKNISISRKIASKRARIDTKEKFTNEEKAPNKLSKIINKLTRFIRKPIYFLRRYFFHYKKTKKSIARMNSFQFYQKNKARSFLLKFIGRYYAMTIVFIAFIFAALLMIRMNYPA